MKEALAKLDPELLFADGYDECIMGITIKNGVPVVLYSAAGVVQKLAEEMDIEYAREFFEFNIAGAYVGERTPVFYEQDDDA